MGKDYTKQHIVPACYLANFGINGNEGRKSKVFYLIKDNHVSGCGSVGNFPVERGFYDISEFGEYEKVLEIFFQKIETDYSDLLKKLINSIVYDSANRTGNCVDYPISKRSELGAQFALQIQRTNMQRNQILSIYEQLCAGLPYISLPRYDKDDFKRIHNKQILALDLANFYANMFADKKWAVLVNHTDLPFWTSDNPLITINHGDQEHVSAASDDLTYYIPISPTIAIEMYPKSVNWNDLTYFDLYDERFISNYNMCIERECTRMVFSNKEFRF